MTSFQLIILIPLEKPWKRTLNWGCLFLLIEIKVCCRMRVEGTLEVVPFESVVAWFWGPPHPTTYHQLTQIILTFSLKMRLIIILHFPFSSRNLCNSTPYHSQLNLPTCLNTDTISYNQFPFSTTHRLA